MRKSLRVPISPAAREGRAHGMPICQLLLLLSLRSDGMAHLYIEATSLFAATLQLIHIYPLYNPI